MSGSSLRLARSSGAPASSKRISVHLAEIEERRLHLEMACSSMFAFCVTRLGFSEDATYNRLGVAHAGRQLPAILDALRSGDMHLSGLRVLVPHLTAENHREVLARAGGKSKREIEELVAALAPKPAVPDAMRKLPRRLHQAQDLLRHRLPSGALASIVESALDLLIEKVKKERLAVGRKPRTNCKPKTAGPCSRSMPASVKRHVYVRDEGRCTFVDEFGNRCPETGMLEYDHIDGWARTHSHDPDRIRLRCRGHNQHAAEQMYGRAFMERARARGKDQGRPGAGRDALATKTPQLCFDGVEAVSP